MAYGTLKCDNITFTNGGIDQTITVSGIVQSISGNITATGTIQGQTIIGTSTVSGATVTGDAGVFTTVTGGSAGFTTVTGTTVTGTTANFVNGTFSTQVSGTTVRGTTVSGATVTGAIGQFTTLTGGTAGFTTVTGTTVTGTTANFQSGVFTTQISGATVTGNVGSFSTITGGTVTLTSGVFGTGTAAAPSIAFTGDSNTGIYSPGADQVAVATNGTRRLLVDASGNLLVGASDANSCSVQIGEGATGDRDAFIDFVGDTTYVDYGARISRSAGANGITYFAHRGTGAVSILAQDAAPVIVSTSNNERLRVTDAGLVGIGTSSPGARLHVGTDSLSGNWSGFFGDNLNGAVAPPANYGLAFGYNRSGGSGEANIAYGTGTGAGLGLIFASYDGTTYTNRVTFDGAGRVGIGTTSPQAPLHVKGGVDANFYVDKGGIGPSLRINAANDAVTANVDLTYQASNHIFTSAGSERARIDTSGRLLVGTSSSTSFVDSNSQTQNPLFQITTDSNANSSILLKYDSGAAGATRRATFAFYRTADGPTVSNGSCLGEHLWLGEGGADNPVKAASISAFVDGTPGANDMPGRLVFSTTADGASSPTERMRITSDGQTYWVASAPSASSFGTSIGRATAGLVETFRNADGTASVLIAGGTAGYARIMGDGDLENTNNSYAGISDVRLKENIIAAGSQWDDLKALQIRKYNFKAETGYNTHTQIGLVAQEVELVSPGLVGESIDEETGESTKSVNYSVLYMKAVKALQEAMERIETLEQRLNDAGIN